MQNLGSVVLGSRDGDPAVNQMQNALRHLGYDLEVDGKFGSGTQTVLRAWQTSRGLPATGIFATSDRADMVVHLMNHLAGPLVAAPTNDVVGNGEGQSPPLVSGLQTPSASIAVTTPASILLLRQPSPPIIHPNENTRIQSIKPWVALFQELSGLTPDGGQGPDTRAAVAALNARHRIDSDETATAETWAALASERNMRPAWHFSFSPTRAVNRLKRMANERFGGWPFSNAQFIDRAVRGYANLLSSGDGVLIRNPYFFVTDFGNRSLHAKRGFLINMETLDFVPIGNNEEYRFVVSHARVSDDTTQRIRRDRNAYDFADGTVNDAAFSNEPESNKTSLGFFTTFPRAYDFVFPAPGYETSGLRVLPHSGEFNDRALSRRIVIHGAEQNTATSGIWSAGCMMLRLDLIGGDENGNLDDGVTGLLDYIVGGGVVLNAGDSRVWRRGDPLLQHPAPMAR